MLTLAMRDDFGTTQHAYDPKGGARMGDYEPDHTAREPDGLDQPYGGDPGAESDLGVRRR